MNIETGYLPNGQQYKLCPACRQAAVLDMEVCRRCGFRYPLPPGAYPPTPYQMAPYPAPPARISARQNTQVFVALGILLAIVLGAGLFFSGSPKHRTTRTQTGGRALGGGLVSAVGVPSEQVNRRLFAAGANTGGDLEVSLAWNSYTDLDLEVGEPSGVRVTSLNRRSPDGGEQDVDMNPTLLTPEGSMRAESGQVPGAETVMPLSPELIQLSEQMGPLEEMLRASGQMGNRAPSRFSTTPVEHIYYSRASGGTYTVYVSCYSWREPNMSPLPFTIDVRSRGKTLFHGSGSIGPANFCANGAPPVPVYQFVRP